MNDQENRTVSPKDMARILKEILSTFIFLTAAIIIMIGLKFIM